MPKYNYNQYAPEGWAIDETGHFIQVPDGFVQQGAEFVSAPAGSGGNDGQANAEWVNTMYQKYFDRPATAAEAANWAASKPEALESFLYDEQKKYNYVSKEQKANGQQNLQSALQQIDADASIPPQLKQYAKDIVTAYGGDARADFKSIMDTFNKLKTETIDPYYASQINFLQKGFEQSYGQLQQNRALEQEQEAVAAAQNIEDTQESLEARGLTFSGEAQKKLGQNSAITGVTLEGLVPQQNRLMASSSALRYQQNQNTLGRQLEQTLGSGAVGTVPGYTAAGGILGSAQESRNQAYGQTLEGIANNQQAKNALNKNRTLDFGS